MAYATQMDAAKQGIITKEMEIVAKKELKTPCYISTMLVSLLGQKCFSPG